ncbi:LOW QUALITY PROTEIN: putative small ubiquitin-related modifier 4 [Raphanus sativus]|uniref:LOW QUALITY PROTEIN: putative small ubiquitin-related modifier 4 n=1 Tax=Raphanus sativus TaxID=3726 RepID=A0A6J0L6M5_RAPSA|nr:LOW QUALITY PROTEIN: putative small ubiquitin-related modifier 4 [Raphanus sativus]
MVNGRDIPITLAELRERLMEMEHTLLTTGVTSSASSSSTHVTVSVKGQDEEEHRVFWMRRNEKMRKVMERYNDARGAEWRTYVFLSEEGSNICEDKTPDEMELKDGYQIDAMLHQHEGFGPSSIMF